MKYTAVFITVFFPRVDKNIREKVFCDLLPFHYLFNIPAYGHLATPWPQRQAPHTGPSLLMQSSAVPSRLRQPPQVVQGAKLNAATLSRKWAYASLFQMSLSFCSYTLPKE